MDSVDTQISFLQHFSVWNFKMFFFFIYLFFVFIFIFIETQFHSIEIYSIQPKEQTNKQKNHTFFCRQQKFVFYRRVATAEKLKLIQKQNKNTRVNVVVVVVVLICVWLPMHWINVRVSLPWNTTNNRKSKISRKRDGYCKRHRERLYIYRYRGKYINMYIQNSWRCVYACSKACG